MSSPTDWPQFYQTLSNQDIADNRSVFGDHHQGSEATSVVSTTTTITSTVVPAASSSGAGSGGHLSPEGRVGKPVRRRSRASRRTPTTLLNTDTTNFRAMVQQFTGSPTSPFSTGVHPGGGPNIGFSFDGRHQALVNPGSLMAPPGGFHLQYQQHQQPQFQHQNQPYMFSLNNNTNNNNNNPVGAGDLFLQRLGRNIARPNMEVAGSEGFVVEGVSSQVPPRNNFLQ